MEKLGWLRTNPQIFLTGKKKLLVSSYSW